MFSLTSPHTTQIYGMAYNPNINDTAPLIASVKNAVLNQENLVIDTSIQRSALLFTYRGLELAGSSSITLTHREYQTLTVAEKLAKKTPQSSSSREVTSEAKVALVLPDFEKFSEVEIEELELFVNAQDFITVVAISYS